MPTRSSSFARARDSGSIVIVSSERHELQRGGDQERRRKAEARVENAAAERAEDHAGREHRADQAKRARARSCGATRSAT